MSSRRKPENLSAAGPTKLCFLLLACAFLPMPKALACDCSSIGAGYYFNGQGCINRFASGIMSVANGLVPQPCPATAAPAPVAAAGPPQTSTASASASATAASATTATTNAASAANASQAFNAATSASNASAIEAITKIGTEAGGSQTSALQSAQSAYALGANQSATVGALNCAQGANTQLTSSDEAAGYYATCQQYLGAAQALQAKQKQTGGLVPDQATMSGNAAQVTLQDFEKNFGVAGDDYMKRMLAPGGGRSALADMVSTGIAEDKLAAAFADADQLDDAAQSRNSFEVSSGTPASKPASTTLRDSLKKKLAAAQDEESAERDLASDGTGAKPPEKIEGLEPLREGLLAADDGKAAELTLFDVVHIKYAELAKKWH